MKLRSFLSLSALAFLGAAGAASGQGTTLYGLTAGGQIVTVDSANPSVGSSPLSVTGINAGEQLLSIDFRPANGLLYGLATNNGSGASSLYTINPQTGAATLAVSGTTGAIALGEGTVPVIDFNPRADLVRVVASGGTFNTRVSPVTGTFAANTPDTTLAYAAGDANAGVAPGIRGVSYTNSFAGLTGTTLYGVDTSTRSLVTIGGLNSSPSPNLGQLFTVGGVSGNVGLFFQSSSIGFEILGDGRAFLVAAASLPSLTDGAPSQTDGFFPNSLYSVNLATGAATRLGGFASNLSTSIISLTAVPVPEPSTVALIAAAGALGVVRAVRRRRQQV